tara:strand:+ start:165 stop:1160 length:996 start_codon:yes stop_codon:yes gene_type:complete
MRKLDFLFSLPQYKPTPFSIRLYYSRNLFFSFFLFLTWLSLSCSGITNSKVGTRSRPLYKSGALERNEVWAGVIQIAGDIVVPEGITLTIKPGAVIGFDPLVGTHQLIVHGSFYAEGNIEGMIVFGSLGTEDEFELPKSGDWLGVRVMPTSPNARLTYCRLQHASTAILCQSDSVHIERCLIIENEIGILCQDTSPFITQNEINKNGTGIQCDQGAESEISYNRLQANEYGVVCNDDARPNIHHNDISTNYQYGVACYASAGPEITANNITSNSGWAVYEGGRLRDNFIRGNNNLARIEQSNSRNSEQFYGVDEVLDPRSSPVLEAGVQTE